MNEFKVRLKRFKRLRNICVISVAALIFIYVGAEPYLEKSFGNIGTFQVAMFALVLAALIVEFMYESKYSKAEKFIEEITLEINDAGSFNTLRQERNVDSFFNAVKEDLLNSGYRMSDNTEVDGLNFDFCAHKGNEYIYCVKLDSTDRNDVIAYLDSARSDLLQNRLKRKGECVVVFLSEEVEESAIALSKAYSKTVVSRYNVITVSPAIVNVKEGKAYFLSNRVSPAQKITAEYIINTELPLNKKCINPEKLDFQIKLEEKMKSFSLNDFKSGKYNER